MSARANARTRKIFLYIAYKAMSGKDSCSKAVCGLVAFCAVVILIVLINQNMNTSGSSFCNSGNVSAARSSQMNHDQTFKPGGSRKHEATKMAETNAFMEAPPRKDNSFTQNDEELIKNYEWDNTQIPESQLSMLSLPHKDFKGKVKHSSGTQLLKEAVYNNNLFSRSVGSKSTMLTLHELTGNNANRTLSADSMPSWGLSDAYMHQLSQ